MSEQHLPLFTQKGTKIPWNSVFSQLRSHWFDAAPDGETRTNRQLADALGASEQHVSGWASHGKSRRTPPSWAVLRLANLTDRGVVLYPDRVAVVKDPHR